MVFNNSKQIIGLNETTFKIYTDNLKIKLTDLKKKIEANQIALNNDKSLKKYLFSFPADHGGIGDILNENQFENVKIKINLTLLFYKTHKFFLFKNINFLFILYLG